MVNWAKTKAPEGLRLAFVLGPVGGVPGRRAAVDSDLSQRDHLAQLSFRLAMNCSQASALSR